MVRILALFFFLLLGIFTFETFTDEDFGVRRSVEWLVKDGFAGGYGIASSVATGTISLVSGVLDGR